MVRTALTGVLVVVLLSSAGAQSRRATPSTGDLVELDAVVLDGTDRPVTGLDAKDFQIREDGRAVDIKTFAEVSDDAEGTPEPRQIVLLLDDSGVPMTGTSVVQAMAGAVMRHMRPIDEVTVVRLDNDRDEPFGDIETALQRIGDYRAGVVPFSPRETVERALRVIARVSTPLADVEHRRKLVVCLGSPAVCNPLEPQTSGFGLLWKPWVAAIAAAARGNVSIYAVMPTPPGTLAWREVGIARMTGGDAFANSSSFDTFVDGIWRDAGHYYLLGYWPAASSRELHSIDVKVSRKGARVRARRRR